MAATVALNVLTGAGPTKTNVKDGNIEFGVADAVSPTAGQRIVIPTSGTAYSFVKSVRLEATGGTFNQIDNINMYTDGANGMGTGVDVFAKNVGSTYTQAVAAASSTTGYNSVFTYTSGSPLPADSTNAGPWNTTGDLGDIIELIMTVASTAAVGTTGSETLTFSYDEQ